MHRPTTRRLLLMLAGLAVLAVVSVGISFGQVPEGSVPDGASPPGQGTGASVVDPADLDKHPKMAGSIAATARTAPLSGEDAALDLARARGLTVVGTTVRVVVESADPDLSATRGAIVAAGGTVEGEYADIIQALLAPSMLEQVANDPAVRYIRAPASGVPNSK
jgi:hypothetical protein